MMRGFAVALVLVSTCDALRLDSVIGRRSAVSLGALAAGIRLPASAFDLPILEDFDDPKARKKAAAMPNPPIGKQQSSAFYAVSTGDMASLQLMVDNGWALSQAKDTAGKTVLHRAAQVGNAPAVDVLIKQGSAVDAVTQWQETPLHMAARNGRVACVKQLAEAGADLSKKTFGGDTALTLAEKYRMKAVVEYLSSK